MAEITREDLFSEEAMNAPRELAASLGMVAKGIDSITHASKESEKVLKGSTSVSKIAKETEQLTIQERELIKVQNQITVALAKNNDEYIEHKRGLDSINRAVKEKIQNGREDLTFTGQMKNAMKDLKQELKDAKNQMLLAADAGGTMSKEYQTAAKQAGEIADKIGDAKDEAKVFANDTAFGAIGTRVGLLKDKMMSLDFKGVGEQLKGIGKIILTNPLLLLAAVVIGIGVALYTFRDSIKPVSDALAFMGKGIDFVIQKLKDFSDWMGISTFAAQDKAKAIIAGAEAEVKAVNKAADQQIAIAAALGKDTVEMEKQKWRDILVEAEKGMKAAFDPSKSLKYQSEQYKGFVDLASDANTQIQVITNKGIKANKDAKNKAADEDKKIADNVTAYMKKFNEGLYSSKAALYKKEIELKKEFLEKFKILGAEDVNISTAIDKAILDSKTSIHNAIVKGQNDSNQMHLDQTAETLAIIQGHYMNFSAAIGNLLSSVTAGQMQDLELQQRNNKNKLDRDLEAAGSNEIAKTDLKKKAAQEDATIEAKKLELKRRMAIYDKSTALMAAAINTAVGITNAASKVVTLPLVPIIAVLGALQIAAILAKPIPKFAGGTDYAPGGLAFVGEKGRELITTPSGKSLLSPDSATLMDLPKGSRIIPSNETMRILAANSLVTRNGGVSNDFMLAAKIQQLGNTIKETNSEVVKAIVESSTDYASQGSLLLRIKKKVDGSKKIIHSRAMGY